MASQDEAASADTEKLAETNQERVAKNAMLLKKCHLNRHGSEQKEAEKVENEITTQLKAQRVSANVTTPHKKYRDRKT